MDGFAHPAFSVVRGVLSHSLRGVAVLPLAVLLVGFVVYAGAVLLARPGATLDERGLAPASSMSVSTGATTPPAPELAATSTAPIVVVHVAANEGPTIFIVGTPEDAEMWRRNMESANAIAEAKGILPTPDRVVLVPSPSDETAIRLGIYLESQLRFAHEMPALRIVDLRH